MGRPKALLPIGDQGEVFATRLIATMVDAGVRDVVLVVGAYADDVRRALAGGPPGLRVVENRAYERGQLSSLLVALDAIGRDSVRAVLVIPVDIPLVTPATVRAVVDAYEARPHPVVRPESNGRHGHPVLFDSTLFGELRAARLDAGARAVVAAHATEVLNVPVTDPGAFIDVDTPEDYQRHIGRWPFP